MLTGAERKWLDLAGDLLAAPLVELPVATIAGELTDTFRSHSCALIVSDAHGVLRGEFHPAAEDFGGHRADLEDWDARNARSVHPILRHYRATGTTEVLQVADVPDSTVGPGVRDAYYAVARPWGCADQLCLPVLGGGAFIVGRAEPFRVAEVDLARRVRRLLLGLDRQCRALAGRGADPAVAGDLRLTARQLAVLALLADGLTAIAIGHRLGISERTVHKHLEHLYARLGVHDRLSAVLQARDHGLLPRAVRTTAYPGGRVVTPNLRGHDADGEQRPGFLATEPDG